MVWLTIMQSLLARSRTMRHGSCAVLVLAATACSYDLPSTEDPVFGERHYVRPINVEAFYTAEASNGAGEKITFNLRILPDQWSSYSAEFAWIDDGELHLAMIQAGIVDVANRKFVAQIPLVGRAYYLPVTLKNDTLVVFTFKDADSRKAQQIGTELGLDISENLGIEETREASEILKFMNVLGPWETMEATDIFHPAQRMAKEVNAGRRYRIVMQLIDKQAWQGDAFKSQDPLVTPARILPHLRAMTTNGDPWGMFLLARLRIGGYWVTRDIERGRRLAQRAQDLGLDRAAYLTGYLAHHGIGEETNLAKAQAHYRRAASAGSYHATYNLALTELESDDPATGASGLDRLKRAAADQNAWAQYSLARRYLDGEGVAADDHKAFALFESAAEAGRPAARAYQAWMIENGRGVEADEKKASYLYLKAARLGDSWAQWQVGERMLKGHGFEKDRKEAKNWLRKAAEAGRDEARKTLARLQEIDREAEDLISGLKEITEQELKSERQALGELERRKRELERRRSQLTEALEQSSRDIERMRERLHQSETGKMLVPKPESSRTKSSV